MKKRYGVIETRKIIDLGSTWARAAVHKATWISITYARVSSGQRCQLNRNGTLMNKSLPVIRYERGYPLLACHVSGFLCLAAAQEIIIGCGSSSSGSTTMPKWDIIPRTRRGTPRRTANFQGSSWNCSGNLRVAWHARFQVTHPRQSI